MYSIFDKRISDLIVALFYCTFTILISLMLLACQEKRFITKVENTNHCVKIYKVVNVATVPNCVEIYLSSKNDSFEKLIVKAIGEDTASVKFISKDYILIEFYGRKYKKDTTITINLLETNNPLTVRNLY